MKDKLEDKVKKYDWKEWLPAYGVVQLLINVCLNKYTIIDEENEFKVIGHHVYQLASGGFLGAVISYL